MTISLANTVQEHFKLITYWRRKEEPWARIIQLLDLDDSGIRLQDLPDAYIREVIRRATPVQHVAIKWAIENRGGISKRLDERKAWPDIVRMLPLPENTNPHPELVQLRTAFYQIAADQPKALHPISRETTAIGCTENKVRAWTEEGLRWSEIPVRLLKIYGISASYSAIRQNVMQLPARRARSVMRRFGELESESSRSAPWFSESEPEDIEYELAWPLRPETEVVPNDYAFDQRLFAAFDFELAILCILADQEKLPQHRRLACTALLRAILDEFGRLCISRENHMRWVQDTNDERQAEHEREHQADPNPSGQVPALPTPQWAFEALRSSP